MARDHNNERGYVHPDLQGRYAVGYTDDNGQFVTLWTEDDTDYMRWRSPRVRKARHDRVTSSCR